MVNWKWLERRRKQRITQKYLTKTTRKVALLLAEKKTRGRKSHKKSGGGGSQSGAPDTRSFCLEKISLSLICIKQMYNNSRKY